MIKDFLKQCRDELVEEKFEIEQTLGELNISMLEEQKFLEAIKSDSDSVFNEFSPRDLNAKNKAREEEVIKKIGAIQAELNINTDKLKIIEDKLMEISVLLTEVSDYSSKIINSEQVQENKENNIIESEFSISNSMIEKLNEIKSLIYLDQASAEKEIDILINSLKSNEI